MSTEVPRYIKCGDKIPQDFNPVGIKQLLTLHEQGQTEVVPVSFDAIASAFTGETGLELPSILVEQLGFNSLRWLLIHHPQSVSDLWIGQKEPNDSFKEAEATIYFEKYIDYSKTGDGSLSPYPDTVYPRSLSLASIGQGKRPAIFAQYYLPYYADHLFRAYIPIQEEDIQELKELIRPTLKTESDHQSEVTEEEALNAFNTAFSDIISSTDNKIPEAMFRLMGNPNPRYLNIYGTEEKSSGIYRHYDFALSQRASLKAYRLYVFNPWIHKDLELIYRHWPNDIILIRIDPNLYRRFTPKYPYFE